MAGFDLIRREALRRCGDASQLLGVRESSLEGGRARGARAVEAWNAAGLALTVLADRGLDIERLSCGGRNLSYLGSPGIVGPAYYDPRGAEWLRGFGAGFLTTCGLRNVGSPCEDEGESFGLHGRASYAPAEELRAAVDWSGPGPELAVSGRTREARVFGENLELRREIRVAGGRNALSVEDLVSNLGFREEPLQLLYHFNLGYPLVDEGARLVAPIRATRPRAEAMRPAMARYAIAEAPQAGFAEQVFCHELRADEGGMARLAFVNRAAGLGVAWRYELAALPELTQWKMMGEGAYVMGVEPGVCGAEGRAAARRSGGLAVLAPGESRRFRVELEFLEGEAALDRVEAEIARI